MVRKFNLLGFGLILFTGNLTVAAQTEALSFQKEGLTQSSKHTLMAQADPWLETLNPHRGKISEDDEDSNNEPFESSENSSATKKRKIKVHHKKKPHHVVTYNQFFGAGSVNEVSEPLGKIIGNLEYKSFSGVETRVGMIPFDYVYLDIGTNKKLEVGDRLVVFSQNREIYHPLLDLSTSENYHEVDFLDGPYDGEFSYDLFDPQGEYQGNQTAILGLVEITELSPNMSKAKVIYNYDIIKKGDHVRHLPPNRPPMVSANYQPPQKELEGYVLSNRINRLMASTHDLVFIDIGSKDNVQRGDRFEVYIYPQSVDAREGTILPHIIGELIIVSTKSETATAKVVKSTSPIVPGQKIRSKRY